MECIRTLIVESGEQAVYHSAAARVLMFPLGPRLAFTLSYRDLD